MNFAETPFDTAYGLSVFSHLLTSALREAAIDPAVKNTNVFTLDVSHHADSVLPESDHHVYYGRYLVPPNGNAPAALWIGLDFSKTAVSIDFTIQTNQQSCFNSVKSNFLNTPHGAYHNQAVKDTVKNGVWELYVRLSDAGFASIVSDLEPESEKVRVLLDFIKAVDAII
jgi:hypothetical protein